MIKWIDINSPKITRIAYNSEIKTMYVDFKHSTIDTPYIGVTEDMFIAFSKASMIDEHFETHIKKYCEKVQLDTENIKIAI